MRHSTLQHFAMGSVMLASLLWLDALPTGWLVWAGKLFLAWAFLSTALVGTVGAWVALGRSRRRWNQRGF